MTVLWVALDVVKEAFARRFMMAVFGFILAGLVALTFALDLEVVEGTLAAGRLFGMNVENPIVPIDIAMGKIFSALAYAVFYMGLSFGIVATADIAATLLGPGRVELLLSLPVRRVELVLGTYLGVTLIALIGTTVAVGGVSAVLFVKAEFITAAPLIGASMAVLGFLAIYAAMLLVTTVVRSVVLAAGSGLLVFFAGVITSSRDTFLQLFEPGVTRDIIGVVIAPLPKLHRLATYAAQTAGNEEMTVSGGPLFLATLAFAAACLAGAAFVVAGKDY